jgi:hypothetical protein
LSDRSIRIGSLGADATESDDEQTNTPAGIRTGRIETMKPVAMKPVTATTIAGSFAMAAFAVAILAGLSTGNAAASVLLRAVVAMLVCYPIGLVAGGVAQRLVQEHIERFRTDHPVMDESALPSAAFDVSAEGTIGMSGETDDEEVIEV